MAERGGVIVGFEGSQSASAGGHDSHAGVASGMVCRLPKAVLHGPTVTGTAVGHGLEAQGDGQSPAEAVPSSNFAGAARAGEGLVGVVAEDDRPAYLVLEHRGGGRRFRR